MVAKEGPMAGRSVLQMLPALYDAIALGGRAGVSIQELFSQFDVQDQVREACWISLRHGKYNNQPIRFYHVDRLPTNDNKTTTTMTNAMGKRKATTVLPTKTKKRKKNDDGEASEDDTIKKAAPTVNRPRTIDMKDEVDARTIDFTEAREDEKLVVVADEALRLKALGLSQSDSVDINPAHIDILELVARTRSAGIVITDLAATLFPGNVKKIHHFLDCLIARQLCVKRIVAVSFKRFNIVHLTKYAAAFQPTMIAPGAVFEDEQLNKQQHVQRIYKALTVSNESSAVFADLAKRFVWSKRLQETIRNYIVQECIRDNTFPISLFMATCRSGERSLGRKLWCVRINEEAERLKATNVKITDESFAKPALYEVGPHEFMYRMIESTPEGLTIPQVRDNCGISDRWCYKKVQALLVSYNLQTEKLLVGRSASYLFRVQGSDSTATQTQEQVKPDIHSKTESTEPKEVDKEYKYASLKSAIQDAGLKPIANVMDTRSQFAMELVTERKIVALTTYRRMLVMREHQNKLRNKGFIDHRTITKIFQQLVKQNQVVFLDVLIPSSRGRYNKTRKVRCVALPSVLNEPEQPTIRHFIETYTPDDLSDLGMLYSDPSFNVVIRDTDGAKKASSLSKQVVYSRNAQIKAQRHAAILSRQNRKIGAAFGLACRTKLFHIAICEIVISLGLWNHKTVDAIPFSLQQVMSRMSVHDFIHIFGCTERLTSAEETELIEALRNKDSDWNCINVNIQSKLLKHKWRRVRRLIEILRELNVLVQEKPTDNASVVPAVFDDVDDMVLRVAEETITGGRFTLNRANLEIPLVEERDKKTRIKLTDMSSFVRPSDFFKYKKLLDNCLSASHTFYELSHVKAYWDVLECISIERTRFELVGQNGYPIPCFVSPCMFVSTSSYVRHAWIDLVSGRNVGQAKKTSSKRRKIPQRHSYNVLDYRPKAYNKKSMKTRAVPHRTKFKSPLVGVPDDKVLELYFKELPDTWNIPVPVELRLPNEGKSVFRSPKLGRSKVNYSAISAKVGDVNPQKLKRRLQVLMKEPLQIKRQRLMEADMLARKNPSGLFLEEAQVKVSPRLFCCLIRAIQMMVQPDDLYVPKVADELFAQWSTSELQMVWRYLWFAHMLVKTTVKDLGHRRGFSLAPSKFDFLRLHPAMYPITMFLEAKDHMASYFDEDDDDIEIQVPDNADPGHMAILLSGAVQGTIQLLPVLAEPHELDICEPPRKKGHAKYVDGVAGHLARFTRGSNALECIEAKWSVTSQRRYDEEEMDMHHDLHHVEDKDEASEDENLKEKLLKDLEDAGAMGRTNLELFKVYSTYSPNVIIATVASLVNAGKVLEAHSYAHLHYVSMQYAELWSIYPYKLLPDKTLEFDKTKPSSCRPWLCMDGSVNEKFLLVLKREVALMVWRYPGMCENDIRSQFRGLLGLQDARSLCFQLVDEDVIYCEANAKKPFCSLFSSPKDTSRPIPGTYHMDRSQYTLRFFPTVSCIENLGAVVDELLNN
ncbi:hypothetical protein THRCLA_07733 [Thraustotheca clavata]|uniref:GTF3C1 extended winged-helix domain-containing protein n=1 Tax=Thraustotheca clavata TaxID=74557 RepID=A0A1V9ZC65_9STRA|nr:hypothetical protein THRCLA_07733 [Thraustotheca clavata]